MTDGIDFERSIARISGSNAAYIVDVLRGAYQVVLATEQNTDGDMALVIFDFIEALEDCDSIEIVDDEEYLIDAD